MLRTETRSGGFNTQPRRGGCFKFTTFDALRQVSTHSRAEAAAASNQLAYVQYRVSTHSRAEAAAAIINDDMHLLTSFNTQPRRGGCLGKA